LFISQGNIFLPALRAWSLSAAKTGIADEVGTASNDDKVGYVGTVIRNKLLKSKTLQLQAASNSREQFANSPDLARAQQDAIMDTLNAHQAMNSQALNNPDLQRRMLEMLLGNFKLWEGLREKTLS
jgi:type I restriction enzyme R subunit